MGLKIARTAALFFLLSCSTVPKNSETGPKSIKIDAPIVLKWKGEKGRVEKTRYLNISKTRTFEGMRIMHERSEAVEFVVKSQTKTVEDKSVSYSIETIYKAGFVNLRDMAFPELGEKLETTVSENGEILKAGNYPKDSIFYIPYLPLPDHPVKVGDSWSYSREWKGLANGLTFLIALNSTLRNVYECGGGADQCYEIEILGDISAPELANKKTPTKKNKKTPNFLKLESKVEGRMLFSRNTASLVWSDVRNIENFEVDKNRVEVRSCTQAFVEDPLQWQWAKRVICDPQSKSTDPIPGI